MKSSAVNTSVRAKAYRHFSYSALSEGESASQGKREFFYIGKDARKIDVLISVFASGYAPDTLESAFSLLERLPLLSSRPDIILFDATLGEIALNRLFCYLASNAYYTNIPLLFEASSLSDEEVKKFRKIAFLDEIIFIGKEDRQKFLHKIDFLKKIKSSSPSTIEEIEVPYAFDLASMPKSIIKRMFDIVVSFAAIIILLPVFAILALLIKLESPGPVIYVSKRAGRGYKIFNFFKFRTMILDADKNVEGLSHLNKYNGTYSGNPIFFKVANDPRITKFGMFLRKTSLDELPQLFNVLKGDMSLVGNRPLPLFEAASLTTDEWAARFLAPAGMTGLWQIKKNDQHNMSVEERISLDIAYAHKYNFLYDLWIMANTPSALIQRSNS